MPFTVEQLAKVIGIPASQVRAMLEASGIQLGASQEITDEQKNLLLVHLQEEQKAAQDTPKSKITLRRKVQTEDSSAKKHDSSTKIHVQILKKPISVKTEARRQAEEQRIVDEALRLKELEALKLEEEKRLAEELLLKQQMESSLKELKEIAEENVVETTGIEEAAEKGKEEIGKKIVDKEAKPLEKKEFVSDRKKVKERGRFFAEEESTDLSDKVDKVQNKTHKTSFKKPVSKQQISHVRQARTREQMRQQASQPKVIVPIIREVTISETITVSELAQKMSVKATEVIKEMMKLGAMVSINQILDQDTAALVVEEMGHKPKILKENAIETDLQKNSSALSITRAPVVTIMGHVDHGKTSLLDSIRRTKIMAQEAGGITQHIGAYSVNTSRGMVTFLDTPGHEAFTAMRARGAKVTDIIVLVVAADDGVMPQTIEAINHAKAAKVPIIVAVNKIDKQGSDPDRVRTELSKYDVISEDWGGDTIFQMISAKQGTGIDTLLESISALSEMLELKAQTDCLAKGVVIESSLDKGVGPMATILVQNGTLRVGDVLLAGLHYGKIRNMISDDGKRITEAKPSTPVVVLGLSGVPSAGDDAIVLLDEKKAREVALFRQGKYREVKFAKQQAAKLENIFAKMGTEGARTLNLVLKADVQGSVEAISDVLHKLATDEVKIKIIMSGAGSISESDINLALASEGIIVGFNVRADSTARKVAEREGVELRYYSVIYQLVDDIKAALSGMLSPTLEEHALGLIEVRDVFRSSKFGVIAGCKVLEGVAKRDNAARVLRNNVVVYTGEIASLRHFKDEVNEVRAGMECGVGIKNYTDIKVGDNIEVYKTTLVKRKL